MTAKNNHTLEPIKAFYHASCGGSTVVPQKVWGARFAGFTKGATCGFCANAPSFRWEYRTSLSELESHIHRGVRIDTTNRKTWPSKYLKNPHEWSLSRIKSVTGDDVHSDEWPKETSLISAAHADDADHRVQKFVFEFKSRVHAGQTLTVNMNAYQARNWFDPVKIKSTLFNLEQYGSAVVFKGRGSGHGVGMCQWGAKHMGELGWSTEKILTHYYPGVKIARLWK